MKWFTINCYGLKLRINNGYDGKEQEDLLDFISQELWENVISVDGSDKRKSLKNIGDANNKDKYVL